MVHNVEANVGLYREHMAGVFEGELIVFSAERDDDDRAGYLTRRWQPHARGAVTVHPTSAGTVLPADQFLRRRRAKMCWWTTKSAGNFRDVGGHIFARGQRV
jgi:hypothetical protein